MHRRVKVILPAFLIIAGVSAAALLIEASAVIIKGQASGLFNKDDWNAAYQFYEPVVYPFFRKTIRSGEVRYTVNRPLLLEGSIGMRSSFRAKKAKDEIRIFLIGESVADWAGNWLIGGGKDILASRFPGKEVVVVNAGGGAYVSAHVHAVAREVVRHEPDLVFVLMGNNIYPGMDAKTWMLLRRPPPLGRLYVNSWVYRSLVDRIYYGDAKGDYGFELFLRDYKDTAGLFKEQRIPFAVTTLPANYADLPPCDPGYYIKSPEQAMFFVLNSEGKFNETLKNIEPASDPFLWYLKGDAQRRSGNYGAARESYHKALELSPGNRAPRRVNDAIRNISGKYGAILIEADKLFEKASGNGLIGNRFMPDNCHWYNAYNALLFDDLVRKINQFEITGVPPVPAEQLTPAKTGYELDAEADKERTGIRNVVPYAASGMYPRESVADLRRMVKYREDTIYGLLFIEPETYLRNINEPWLEQFSEDIAPGWHRVLTYAGEAYRQEGDIEMALLFLDAALARNPDAWEAYFFRALAHIRVMNLTEAGLDLERAAELCGFEIPASEILSAFSD